MGQAASCAKDEAFVMGIKAAVPGLVVGAYVDQACGRDRPEELGPALAIGAVTSVMILGLPCALMGGVIGGVKGGVRELTDFFKTKPPDVPADALTLAACLYTCRSTGILTDEQVNEELAAFVELQRGCSHEEVRAAAETRGRYFLVLAKLSECYALNGISKDALAEKAALLVSQTEADILDAVWIAMGSVPFSVVAPKDINEVTSETLSARLEDRYQSKREDMLGKLRVRFPKSNSEDGHNSTLDFLKKELSASQFWKGWHLLQQDAVPVPEGASEIAVEELQDHLERIRQVLSTSFPLRSDGVQ